MSLTKRIKGDFTIETVDTGADDTITLHPAGTDGIVIIDGNLSVLGTTTTIESVDTEIVDNTIILNSGEVGNGVTAGESGLEIDRGTALPAGIRFNETLDIWQVNEGNGTWITLVTGLAGTMAVVEDLDPHLGDDLIVNGFSITSEPASNGDVVLDADGTGQIKVNARLSLEQESTPASYNEIYADAIGPGGTGLYTGADEELVSKSKAILFGLIF